MFRKVLCHRPNANLVPAASLMRKQASLIVHTADRSYTWKESFLPDMLGFDLISSNSTRCAGRLRTAPPPTTWLQVATEASAGVAWRGGRRSQSARHVHINHDHLSGLTIVTAPTKDVSDV